jgi:predicted negative regulator of RcsB-dependent stress response
VIKFLFKYWAQIVGVLTVVGALFGWCWRLAIRIETNLQQQQQFEKRVSTLETSASEHDDTLDDHDRRIMILEKIEELREKQLLK